MKEDNAVLQTIKFSDTQKMQATRAQMRQGFLKLHTAQIEKDIEALGAVKYDLLLPETHALPFIIHPDERIIGIVYGRYKQQNGNLVGRGALIATNERVLLLDKKPLFVRLDEITYFVVSGVTYSRVALAGTVTLHSRTGDTSVRTFNQNCARSFVEAVESVIYKNTKGGAGYDYAAQNRAIQAN